MANPSESPSHVKISYRAGSLNLFQDRTAGTRDSPKKRWGNLLWKRGFNHGISTKHCDNHGIFVGVIGTNGIWIPGIYCLRPYGCRSTCRRIRCDQLTNGSWNWVITCNHHNNPLWLEKMRSCSFLLVQFQDHPSNWCGNIGGTFPRPVSGLNSRTRIYPEKLRRAAKSASQLQNITRLLLRILSVGYHIGSVI